MSLFNPGIYTVQAGGMTHGRNPTPLVEIGDQLHAVPANTTAGIQISVTGSGLLASENIIFDAFADGAGNVWVASAIHGVRGHFTLVLRETSNSGDECEFNLIVTRKPGGEDSGGEWSGNGGRP